MSEQKVPKIADLFDLEHTIAAPLFEGKEYPWEVLDGIKDFILQLGPTLDPEKFDNPAEGVWIAKDAKIYPNANICGSCIIGHKTEVRPGAFVRCGLRGGGLPRGAAERGVQCLCEHPALSGRRRGTASAPPGRGGAGRAARPGGAGTKGAV